MPGLNTLISLGIIAGAVVVGIIGIFAAIKKFYHVAKADEALVKTGGKKLVVSVGGGLWVIPMFHEITRISTRAFSVPIERIGENAVPSEDMIPAEIKGEMKVQINPAKEDDIILAAQSLGATNPQQMAQRVQIEIDGLVTDALRTAAFKKTFIELNSQKKEFADEVLQLLGDDLQKFGLTLKAVAVTHVKQGDFLGGDGDVIDAGGRRNVAETVEKNRQETNLITRNAEVKIATQNVDAQQEKLAQELREKKLIAEQGREVAEYEAEQKAETTKNVLLQTQAEETAEAAQERAIAEAKAKEAALSEKAEITKLEQVAIANAKADAAQKSEQELAAAVIAEAEAERKVREEEADRKKEEAGIAKIKAVETADIEKNKAVEEARIAKEQAVQVADEQRQQAIEEAEVVRQVAVAEKRAEEAVARAVQATEEAKQKEAEEAIITVKETAEADRSRKVVVIKAQEDSEKDKITADKAAYVSAKQAEGERDASVKRAEGVKAKAEGEADAAKAIATGDAEARKARATGEADAVTIAAEAYATDVTARADADFAAADKQADAKTKLAAATLKEGEADAESERLMVEAKNKIAPALVLRDVALKGLEVAPAIVHEIMFPVGQVAHDVKILQVNGLGGENGEGVQGLPATILNTGLAAAGIKPFLADALRTVAADPEVQETVGLVTGVVRTALREGAAGVREGLTAPDNGTGALPDKGGKGGKGGKAKK